MFESPPELKIKSQPATCVDLETGEKCNGILVKVGLESDHSLRHRNFSGSTAAYRENYNTIFSGNN
ncbi:hypothetical protein KKF55_03305 [Patescibacteria group bacterium]|nr:hypothetical protein [Patescibacteria group bacterium]